MQVSQQNLHVSDLLERLPSPNSISYLQVRQGQRIARSMPPLQTHVAECYWKTVRSWNQLIVCALAGEARTKAMADAAGAADNDDYAFDSFADPGGLIMSSIIEKHLKEAPNKQRLLERAKALKLPGNPLVSTISTSQTCQSKRLGLLERLAQ